MKQNYIPLFLIALSLLRCAAIPDYTFHSLSEDQPYVTEISPQPETSLEEPVEISLKFSERIEFESMEEDSIILLEQIEDPTVLADSSRFLKDLNSGKLQKVLCQMMLDSNETNLTLLPEAALQNGTYYVVVTPHLLSAKGIPFNQTPGKGPNLFVAKFTSSNGIIGEGNPNSNQEIPTGTFGPSPENLVINEFLYDGLTSETDGESFVELAGTAGADISLYQIVWVNGSDGEITDRVTLPTGSIIPSDGIFLIADLSTNSTNRSKISDVNFLDNFDPQNGPDGIQLIDREGNLIDSVVYGEGAAATSALGLPLGEGSPTLDVAGGHSLSRRDGVDTENNSSDFIDLSTPTPGVLNPLEVAEPPPVPVPTPDPIPEPTPPSPDPIPTLVLNEILYDGLSSETDGESFVEFFGTPGMDISSYQISFINGADGAETDKIILPQSSLIPEDGIFVIADLRTNSTTTTQVLGADFLDNFDPQNAPDAVLLLNSAGELMDAVTYGTGAVSISSSGIPLGEGSPALDVSGGHSLSRVEGVDTQNNSEDFVDLIHPTPGFL